MKKYNFFVGNYGSGKTEISINSALAAADDGKKTILVDMDIVNPYFRASEHMDMLKEKGIDVVIPSCANTLVDVPSLPAEIVRPFQLDYDFAVFDAGGDPVGAAALGLLADRVGEHKDEIELYYVVNTRRPLQTTPEDILTMLRQIEGRCSMKVTGLVNNTNLSFNTTADVVLEGQAILKRVSELTGIPIAFTCVDRNLGHIEGIETEIIPLDFYTRVDWA